MNFPCHGAIADDRAALTWAVDSKNQSGIRGVLT
jgi:hypothetical protein